ncbi:MAG: glycosyltransferase [Candidatus Hydrogenedens sp.]|nr:glycosyltransferase [Candidatus Hydrogenedens sp.]
MKASVVIPAYNASRTLPQCLAALASQSRPPHEIIVVDDGSTDGTPELAAQFPNARFVTQDNAGPAAARNRGASEATGDWIVFTDADCVPPPDWLERLLTPEPDTSVAGVGGGYTIANPGALLARVIQAEIGARHARMAGTVDFLGSFNVAYRREAYASAGGFDTRFRQASGEDNDLAYRIHEQGGTLRFAPDAPVAHFHPERLLPYLRTQLRHGYWRVLLYRTHQGRTATGDAYAGAVDLLAPPLAALSLGYIALALLATAFGEMRPLGLVPVLLMLQCGLHLGMARRISAEDHNTEALAFPFLAALRDVARAAGLVWGAWHFVVLRRES